MSSAVTSASDPDRVEVVTSVQRRRRWPLSEKPRAVEEASVPGMTVSYIARKYGIAPSLLFRWGRVMTEGGHEAVRTDDQVVAAAEARELKRQIRDLERLLGKKTLENEILREAWALAKSRTVVARTRAAGGASDEVQVPHG
jgi:transposase